MWVVRPVCDVPYSVVLACEVPGAGDDMVPRVRYIHAVYEVNSMVGGQRPSGGRCVW